MILVIGTAGATSCKAERGFLTQLLIETVFYKILYFFNIPLFAYIL